MHLDETSLLVCVPGAAPLADVERQLLARGYSLGLRTPTADTAGLSIAAWLEAGAPGAPDPYGDPADHLVAGFDAELDDGRAFRIAPSPRRATGPDLFAFVLGQKGRFVRLREVWLRVHRVGAQHAATHPFVAERDPPVTADEVALWDSIASALADAVRAARGGKTPS
jgi:alkyldihydroxyacetonephosphate synthase